MRQQIFFFVLAGLSIFQINAQDIFPVRQLTFDPAQQGFPSWSPDGDYILFQRSARYDTTGKNGLWVINADGKDKKQIFSGLAEHPSWSPEGSLIVFDTDTGKNVKLISPEGGVARYFLPEYIQIERGSLPVWSPDGKKIAFIEGSSLSLYVYDIKTDNTSKICHKDGYAPLPCCWTDDGKSILVGLMDIETRRSTIWRVSPDGKWREQVKGHHENFYRHLDLSPDGSLLVYSALIDGSLGLYIMSMKNGTNIPLSLTPGNHNEGPCWSPDGKTLAFTSTRSGNHDIWLMDIDIKKTKKMLRK